MSVISAASHAALASGAKLVGALVAMKIIASDFGPEGLGQLGQFMGFVALLSAFACGGASVGVTRLVSELHRQRASLRAVLQTASCICFVSCAVSSAIVFFWADSISLALFKSPTYSIPLQAGCLLFLPIAFSSLGLASLSGLSASPVLSFVQVGSAIAGALGLVVSIKVGGQQGATLGLLWIAASPSFFFFCWWMTKREDGLSLFLPVYHKATFSILLRYSLLALLSVTCHQAALFFLRSWLHATNGWHSVGHWQAMSRMSDAYLQMFNIFLLTYFFPKLTGEIALAKLRRELNQAYSYVLPVLGGVLIFGYCWRDLIIRFFLDTQFYPVRDLFLPQMLGDFAKIAAYIPGYLALARGYMPALILADPLQMCLLLIISRIVVQDFGAVGIAWAYCATYFLYLTISLYAARAFFKKVV